MPRWTRLLTIVLFAGALALRGWVPAGWMPAPGAPGLSIMPCPAADPATMNMARGDPAHHGAGIHGDCFSALLAGAALPDPAPALLAPLPAPAATRAPLTRIAAPRGSGALPPPSTGPPALA